MKIVVRVLGLVLVAVLSGALWLAFRSGGSTDARSGPPPGNQPASRFNLAEVAKDTNTECHNHASSKVKAYLTRHPCESLTRWLYNGTAGDGSTIVVAVASVIMPNAQQANELRTLLDTNGTGNVNDLLKEGHRIKGGPRSLGSNAAYQSVGNGHTVLVAESACYDTAQNSAKQQMLRDAASDAITLAGQPG